MDLKGRTCIITGATSGIGEATATELAGLGATLGLLCRDEKKGRRTLEALRAKTGNDALHLFRADLASQADIRNVAGEILSTFDEIHLLVNNAGVVNVSYTETVDGIENTFAVNHLAYFLLTNLLLERVRASAPARIVNVASDAHKFVGGLNFDDLQHREKYASMRAYGRSKLANILFTKELAKRLEGSGVTVNAVHPGAVATGLGGNNGAWAKAIMKVVGLFFNSPAKGAATSLFAATSPDLEGVSGRYYAKCKEVAPTAGARDDDAAARLWTISEEMTGLATSSASVGQ
ncbi:MAG: SDR family oxidoreductase [Candidatus Binatia bacterium]|nr:SDR family oxidoreductase [Candidatus Binatia bacterium]